MAKAKKVYIVRGNHDGNLGVFSNFKKAYDAAFDYASDEDGNAVFYKGMEKNGKFIGKYVKASYQKALKESKYCFTLERSEHGDVLADIGMVVGCTWMDKH
jgi:hypothetical protein